MTTPRGCLKSITTAFKRLARNGDVEGLRAYLRSDAFMATFGGLDPERRQSAMRSYMTAEALCETRAPLRQASITSAFKRLAHNGDVEGFRAYLRSDTFLAAFSGLDPERRESAMRSYATAEALCEAKAPYRLVKPKPIHTKRAQKASWGSPVMLAKLANAYVRAGGDDEKAARILGVTVGSARLAKRRHLDAPATDHRQKAS